MEVVVILYTPSCELMAAVLVVYQPKHWYELVPMKKNSILPDLPSSHAAQRWWCEQALKMS